MIYRPDIDGLRAVAVLPVLLYHAGFQAFSGGFVGVDVFFVISGYLITSIIAQEIQEGRFSIVAFYERRARRLFPALIAVLTATCLVSLWLLVPGDLISFGRSLIATVLFSSNILFWSEADYFDSAAELKPLLHTWSLAVEEQYYIVMPLLLLFLFRRRLPRAWVLGGLALLSFGVSVWSVRNASTAAFYLPHSRAWELLIGSLLAVRMVPPVNGKWLREGVAAIGLGLILTAVFAYTKQTTFPGGAALLPCIGAALILHAGEKGPSSVGQILSAAPMLFIGRISYSLYLWHWPIIALAKYALARNLTGLEGAGAIGLSFVLATASWAFIERPFRERRWGGTRWGMFSGVAVGSALAFVVGITFLAAHGLPNRFPSLPQKVAGPEFWNRNACFMVQGDEWQPEKCVITGQHPVKALLWGDSHAAHYTPGFTRNQDEIGVSIMEYTRSLCQPLLGFPLPAELRCDEFNAAVPDIVKKYGIKLVIMSGGFGTYGDFGLLKKQIAYTIDTLHSLGAKVIFMGRGPVYNFLNPLHELQARGITTQVPEDFYSAAATLPGFNDPFKKPAAKADFFFDPLASICRPKECLFISKGRIMVIDNGHLSVDGSDLIVKELVRSIRANGDPVGLLRY